MPVYEYRCRQCGVDSSLVSRVADYLPEQVCEHCGGLAERIISTPFVRLSKISKLEKLDPKYDKLVDRAMRSTPLADPDRLLKKMKPFDKSSS